MYTLQKLYSNILNQIYSLTGKIDERIRNAIISLCCVFLAVFFVLYYDSSIPFNLYLNHTKNNIICGIVLIIITICSINAPLKRVKWDPVLFGLLFVAGFGLFAISFLHPIGSGYRSFGLMMMFGFPCLYFVWNNRGDYDILYERLSSAFCTVGLIFTIYCIRMALHGELQSGGGRVNAFLMNANLFSMIGMSMACSALYMLAIKRHSVPWFVFSAIAFASGLEVVILGVSRISMIVCLGSIFALFIYSLKTYGTLVPASTHKISIIRWVTIGVLVIIAVSGGSALMDVNNRVAYLKSNTGNEASQIEAIDTEASKNTTSAADRFDPEGKDLDTYTAGRISIWEGYYKHLNMWGNDFSKTDLSEIAGEDVKHAHNNFLEFAYRCGIPVASVHILLELYAGILCIGFLFKRKYDRPYYLYAVIFMICYAFESTFDIATLPFERHAPFFFYMALIPIFGRTEEKE